MKINIQNIALRVGALTLLLAPGARAACSSAGMRSGFPAAKLLSHQAQTEQAEQRDAVVLSEQEFSPNASIVGLWNVTFLLGNGPTVWDQGFEQWHSDGTELNVDNAVPPSLGNVCVGVYKQTGLRSFKLRHVTWNWDLSGNLTGTFLLIMNVTLDARGNIFTGTYVSDSFDLSGKTIPALHAEGILRATRITVD